MIVYMQVLRDHETFEEQVEGLKRKQAGCTKNLIKLNPEWLCICRCCVTTKRLKSR